MEDKTRKKRVPKKLDQLSLFELEKEEQKLLLSIEKGQENLNKTREMKKEREYDLFVTLMDKYKISATALVNHVNENPPIVPDEVGTPNLFAENTTSEKVLIEENIENATYHEVLTEEQTENINEEVTEENMIDETD